MKKGEYLAAILRSKQTVFTTKELALLWGDSGNAVRVRLNYYLKTGALYHIRRGLYAKDADYDRLELATKIYTPSYVSFETVLGRAGITFQYHGQIHVASYLTREIVADGQRYTFHKLKGVVLADSAGIDHRRAYAVASPERAFLDTLYLHPDYHFDNLGPLDWEKVREILPIYRNRRLNKTVDELHKSILSSQ